MTPSSTDPETRGGEEAGDSRCIEKVRPNRSQSDRAPAFRTLFQIAVIEDTNRQPAFSDTHGEQSGKIQRDRAERGAGRSRVELLSRHPHAEVCCARHHAANELTDFGRRSKM